MTSFKNIPDILDHIWGKFSHMVWVGKEYSIADLIRDLERIDERMGAEIARSNAVLDRILERRTPVLELSPTETVQRLRAHVRERGGPTKENGVWELMLHAADLLEDLHEDSLVGPGQIADSFPSEGLRKAFFNKEGEGGVPAERLAEPVLNEAEDTREGKDSSCCQGNPSECAGA